MLVRMANTQPDAEASRAARALVRQRWGNRGAVRAAEVVIARCAELSPEQLEAVAEALKDVAGDAVPG